MNAASPPRHRVAITGMGCVSPLGPDCAGAAAALADARDCVSPVEAFDVSGCKCRSAGQIPDAWLDRAASATRRARRWNRASQMLLLAAIEALGGREDFAPDAVVIGTTSGGMTFGEAFYRMFERGARDRRAPQWVRDYMPQQPVRDAMGVFGFEAPVRIVSNACASGTNALGAAFHLVRSGRARRVLCGGYDALCELVFAGFSSLQAATEEKCRPFDAQRSGLVLGEGAAVFLLEPLADALRANRAVLAEIAGYGASTDNHHLTQPNPDGSGPRRAMESALTDAGWSGGEIEYVNAHGTATPFNDACEARALAAVCPGAPVSSTKGQMGHSLGAAGAIEAAFCVLAMRGGFLPANVNFRAPDAGVALDIVANTPRRTRPRRVLSNSLGFGGANASLLLEAAES
ncbi:MAG: beta-ketoacyl-[acyl-carrier-protein] synthase family protein [Terrimicrobiaceae bacterium]|nr:beta-ketoacyl-[acyl-carrier-protein] synthase family protein [Terrimicrobiaceae bacterium]